MLVSVIIPCYQAENYIRRCLNSVLSQSYTDLEIIVVDDGSTDSSAEIVKEIAGKDSRVKYLYQTNAGVSAARNKGIDNASGELVTFVDSDDTINSEMYRTLVDLMIRYNADVSHCSYCRNTDGEIKNIGGTNEEHYYQGEEIAYSLLEATLIGPSCCNKLFKKNIIENIRFYTRFKIGEDSLFDFQAFQNAKTAVFIDSCFYTYYSSETSACVNTEMVKKTEDLYQVNSLIYEQSLSKSYEQIAFMKHKKSLLSLYRTYSCFGRKSYKNEMREIRKQIINDYNMNLFAGTAKKEAMIIKYMPFLLKPIYSIYNKIRKPNWDL